MSNDTETDVTKVVKELFPKTNCKTNDRPHPWLHLKESDNNDNNDNNDNDSSDSSDSSDVEADKFAEPIPVLCHACNYVAYVTQGMLDTKGAPICPVCQEYYLNEMGKDRKRVNLPESPEPKSGVTKMLEDMFGWKAEVI